MKYVTTVSDTLFEDDCWLVFVPWYDNACVYYAHVWLHYFLKSDTTRLLFITCYSSTGSLQQTLNFIYIRNKHTVVCKDISYPT